MVAEPMVTARTSPGILVVEDNADLLEVLGMLLDYERFRCIPAADGQQAIERLTEQCPALVILDWLLPGVSGPQVLEAIRGRYGRAVPVLVLSRASDGEWARRAGADAFLRMPYAAEELVGTIRWLLGPGVARPD